MPALLFDLYGVLLRVQDPEHLARIEEAAGHSGEAFWSAYWDCRPDYDAGLVSTHGYWSRVADRLDAPIRTWPTPTSRTWRVGWPAIRR